MGKPKTYATQIEALKTVKNYAALYHVTPSYIYKLIKEEKMEPVVVDGVQFIDVDKFPKLPTAK